LQEEDDTYTKHLEGFIGGGVAPCDAGEDFFAHQVAFEERTMAKFVEKTTNFSESPA
jgi:hypothetical protein